MSASVRAWRCVCDAAWFNCPVHARVGFACKARPRAVGIKRGFATRMVKDTNLVSPPDIEDEPRVTKVRRLRVNTDVRMHVNTGTQVVSSGASKDDGAFPISAISSSCCMSASANGDHSVRGVKRGLSTSGARTRAKAKAKHHPGHSADARAAIERIRAARASPI